MKNEKILYYLENLLNKYKKDSSLTFKSKALTTSISNIKKYDQEILCGTQAMNDIKGIGKGIADRIDEIINKGYLEEIGKLNEDFEKVKVMDILKSITGVGDVRAEKWYESGIRSIEDVKKGIEENKISTTHHINVGIKYYNDIAERIPRSEMDKLKKKIEKYLKKIDKNLVFEICGSYRRNQESSGDIDVIVSNPNYIENISSQNYLHKIIETMSQDGFLLDHLTEKGDTKYMGICRNTSKSKARRIDIRVFDYIAYYAGVIYFTGSKDFNIMIRNKAIEKGMSLNEYGFSKIDTKEKIFLKSEEELFQILNIPYKHPHERNI